MKRLLIVDDSRSVRKSLREILEAEGYIISEASNGEQALKLAIQGLFNLIITDLHMPVMDGFALCDAIKKNPATRSIPIIIFSDLSDSDKIDTGFMLGARAFVSKTTPDELISCIENLWKRRPVTQRREVLVVDDSTTMINVISDELSLDGYEVHSAQNGEEAWMKIQDGWKPDIIVSDLYMPKLDGIGLIKRLKSVPELSLIPVVIMSIDDRRSAIMNVIQAGAVSYLTKPFGSGQLALQLDMILSNQFLLLNESRLQVEHEQDLMMAAMTSLANALEAKDPYTRGHSESVSRLAVMLGQTLEMDASQIMRLELAGRLHDLGKIGIRDEVLCKPGKLTPEEFSHIKTHTLLLESILSPIPSIHDILEGAMAHHERWDGKGYPKGLVGTQIPLWGRILALADVYDALTSQRTYRPALPPHEALDIIKQDIGKSFCPSLGPVFVKMIKEQNYFCTVQP